MSKWYSIGKNGEILDQGGSPAPQLHLPDMEKTDQIADKIVALAEFRILQLLPRPECQTKRIEHKKLVEQIKRKVAHKLWPINEGVQVKISP